MFNRKIFMNVDCAISLCYKRYIYQQTKTTKNPIQMIIRILHYFPYAWSSMFIGNETLANYWITVQKS